MGKVVLFILFTAIHFVCVNFEPSGFRVLMNALSDYQIVLLRQ